MKFRISVDAKPWRTVTIRMFFWILVLETTKHDAKNDQASFTISGITVKHKAAEPYNSGGSIWRVALIFFRAGDKGSCSLRHLSPKNFFVVLYTSKYDKTRQYVTSEFTS